MPAADDELEVSAALQALHLIAAGYGQDRNLLLEELMRVVEEMKNDGR